MGWHQVRLLGWQLRKLLVEALGEASGQAPLEAHGDVLVEALRRLLWGVRRGSWVSFCGGSWAWVLLMLHNRPKGNFGSTFSMLFAISCPPSGHLTVAHA